MSFSMAVNKWTINVSGDIEKLRKAVMVELFSSVVLDTPVDTGRLRGNWIISSGAPNSGMVEILDKVGKITTAKIRDHVKKLPPEDQEVFLANNLPYAHRIEFDGWSHTKAPEGMVRKNFIRVSNNLKKKYG